MGVGEGGWVVSAPHATRSRVDSRAPHTRSAASPEARGPPLGGSMRPCAAACLRGHTAWLGGVAAWFDGGFPWVQSRRALAHLSRRRREIRRSGALDGLVAQGSAPCAHALRASACATAEGAGGASARSQRAHIAHLWDVDGEEAAGSHAWAATRSACSRRARSGAACHFDLVVRGRRVSGPRYVRRVSGNNSLAWRVSEASLIYRSLPTYAKQLTVLHLQPARHANTAPSRCGCRGI